MKKFLILSLGILFFNSFSMAQNTYNVPGHFSTLTAALTFPLYTGDKIIVVSGPQTVSSSINVPTGVTLQVNAGVTITFNNGLTVYGNLITNGTAVNNVNINFIATTFNYTSFFGKGDLTYTNFAGPNWNGIRFYSSGSDNSKLDHCTMNGTLVFNGTTDSKVGHCTISSNSSIAIQVTNSSVSIYKNTLENNLCAIIASNSYVDSYIEGNNIPLSCSNGNNRIKGNEEGVFIANNSLFNFKMLNNNYNNISGNTVRNVRVETGSILETESNYFGNPPVGLYFDGTSTIFWYSYLICEPTAPKVGVVEENTSISIAPQLKQVAPNDVSSDIAELKKARELARSENYNEAINIYKSILSTSKDYKAQALIGISYIYRTTKDKDLLEYIKIYSKSEANPFARMTYANTLIASNYVEEALLEYTEIAKNNPATIHAKSALIQQAYIYYFNKNDERKVKEILAELEKISEKDDIDVKILRSIVVRDRVKKYEESEELVDDNAIKETEVKIPGYSLSNYPNPFNPTTTLQFSIPKDEFVKLTVYDVTGRVVKELVSEYKTTGTYNVEFNASSYSSGTYYYKLEAGEYKNIQKMMLIK